MQGWSVVRRNTISLAAASLVVLVACTSSGGDDTSVSPTTPADDGSVESTSTASPASTGSEVTITDEPPSEQASDSSPGGGTSSTLADQPGAVIGPVPFADLEIEVFPVPAGSRPHDVAPALDGGVWYTAQRLGELGYLDPESGATRHIPLGPGSAPHGVIVDADGSAWVTDGGLNAIVSVDPATDAVTTYPLPRMRRTPTSTRRRSTVPADSGSPARTGFHGVLDPESGEIEAFPSPRGRGPYGIAATPDGEIYFASLAGSYIGLVADDGSVVEIDPPTPSQGARRVWSDSTGAIWVSEWNSGQLSRFDPDSDLWQTWTLPGEAPSTYAVYVDDADQVWVSDFGGNAIHRFDPTGESFETFELPADPGNVRQILGRETRDLGRSVGRRLAHRHPARRLTR